jgi:REP element-mobilizing transposase RayT
MGRHHRDLTRSEWFHVYNRGADRQDIFSADGDWTLFEQLTAEAFERFAIELHAYALMTNHFHFLGRAGDGGLSEAMQRLCGRYGAAYNERTGRTGSLFTGRFQSVPITSDAQLTQTARYIHRNPLAIVPAAALDTYRWSSLGVLTGQAPRARLARDGHGRGIRQGSGGIPPLRARAATVRPRGVRIAGAAHPDDVRPDRRGRRRRHEPLVCAVGSRGPPSRRRSDARRHHRRSNAGGREHAVGRTLRPR